jgi:transcriptional regulator GlxA family with amidase domain
MSITTGILLFDGVEELDFVGPWEVLTMAAARREGDDRVVTISENGGQITCAKRLRVLSDHSFADAPDLDVVVVPGGRGTRTEVDNQVVLDWLAKVSPTCTWVTSVCTGSMLLCAAGLATGKRITTHWSMVEAVREKFDADVLSNARYVRDGNVVTAAGVSAGIDMALWLVGQLYDEDYARLVQKYIEYDPAPPYAAYV